MITCNIVSELFYFKSLTHFTIYKKTKLIEEEKVVGQLKLTSSAADAYLQKQCV